MKSLYLNISDSVKDGSSKLNDHSDVAIGKFIIAPSDPFIFRFISKLFSLRF